MTFAAPVIRPVACCVFDHADAYVAEMLRLPIRHAGFTLVFGPFNSRPIGDRKRNSRDLQGHSASKEKTSEKKQDTTECFPSARDISFNRTMWAPQSEFLAKHYRFFPDLCGYGENKQCGDKTLLSTFASDGRELADSLGLEKFVLGGLSMGGQIVLECYRHFRESCTRFRISGSAERRSSGR